MIKLYEYSRSRSIRIHWLLKELRVPFESVIINLREGEQFSEEYKKIHPLGKVPAIIDGDFVLFESAAICNYLCENYFDVGLIPDPATKERALYDQWMSFTLTELDAKLWSAEGHLWRYPKEARFEGAIKHLEKEIKEALSVVNRELSYKANILGSSFYAVDVMLTQTLLWAKTRGHTDGFEKILSYIERNTNREAFPRHLFEEGK